MPALPGLRLRKLALGVSLMLLGACAQKHIVTNVNQFPLFSPSHLSYAARDGSLPMEVYGTLPAAITMDQLKAGVHLPGNYPPTKLVNYQARDNAAGSGKADPASIAGPLCLQHVLDAGITQNGNNCHGPSRLVLIFNPAIQTQPDLACEAANSITTSAGQDIRVLAAFCIGKRLASSGQVRIPATNGDISSAINVLLMDMLQSRPGGGRETEHRRL